MKKQRLIARLGLCAAAAVFAASLGVLIFQASPGAAAPLRSLTPIEAQSAHTSAHSAAPADSHTSLMNSGQI